jgi:hypothetical protein
LNIVCITYGLHIIIKIYGQDSIKNWIRFFYKKILTTLSVLSLNKVEKKFVFVIHLFREETYVLVYFSRVRTYEEKHKGDFLE